MITEDDIQGYWIRDWIKAPGYEDHTTRVHWIQVGTDYADIRVPLERPDISTTNALSDLSARSLLELAQAEGFVGHVTLEGNECTWHREVNWHGQSDAVDVGDIRFDASGKMIETGVHANYTELWARSDGTPAKALRFQAQGYRGIVASRGSAAVLGIGRSDKAATNPIIETLTSGVVPKDVADLFDGLHVLGHWSGNSLIADLATQPFAEGLPAVTIVGTALVWHHIAFNGDRHDVEMVLDKHAI